MATWQVDVSSGTNFQTTWWWTFGGTLTTPNPTNVNQLRFVGSDGTQTVLTGAGLSYNGGTVTWQRLDSVVHQTAGGGVLETISSFDPTIGGPQTQGRGVSSQDLLPFIVSLGDSLQGNSGADWLDGGRGNDIITGGPGADVVFGGDGNDTFRIGAGEWVPTVFVDGAPIYGDRILVQGIGNGTDTIQLENVGDIDLAATNIGTLRYFSGTSRVTIGSEGIRSMGLTTIIGSAGIDTLNITAVSHRDLSGLTFTSWTPGQDIITITVGPVGGGGGYFGSVIGTAQDDRFLLTPGASSTLTGGLNGGPGTDTAVFDRASTQMTWARNGDGTWAVTGAGGVTLSNVEFLQFTDRTVRLPTTPPPSDFNHDGKSDLLLQGGGTLAEWFLSNGAYAGANTLTTALPAGWSVVGTGDFNGDGFSDLVLQGGATVVEWFLNASGGYAGGNVLTTAMPVGWQVVGTGDVNGDGVTDLVLQGGPNVVDWVLNASGGYQAGNVLATGLPANWQVVGVGDLNGDAIADVLLQGGNVVVDWLLNASGGYAGGNVLTSSLPAGWTARALGDFNGDGTSDVALQGGNYVVDWIMQNGNVVGGNVISSGLPAGWNVTGSGDYNGDGTSDLSLQGGGIVVDWLLSNGQYAGGNVLATNLPAGWSVVGKT